MESGAFWIGIVAPATAVLVSAYLVWRAIRDERRFSREESSVGEGAAPPGTPSGEPSWTPDPHGWMEDLGDWEPSSSEWSPEDAGWSPDVEDHGDR